MLKVFDRREMLGIGEAGADGIAQCGSPGIMNPFARACSQNGLEALEPNPFRCVVGEGGRLKTPTRPWNRALSAKSSGNLVSRKHQAALRDFFVSVMKESMASVRRALKRGFSRAL